MLALVLLVMPVAAGCGGSRSSSASATGNASSPVSSTDALSDLADLRPQIVTDDLVPLDSGSNPPSRDQISAAENALMTEASDLGQAGDTTVQSYVSDEAQALSSQLSGQPAIDVEADLDIAVTRRAAAATQANEPGCVVAAPAPRSAPTSTAATPGSSYRRPPCTSPGPSGAPETKPSCINQEGCRAVTVKSGSISCASALSIAEAAISSDQQTDNLNPTVKGFSCNVYPYEVDCASAGTSFSTNFGDTGQQSG